MKNTFKLFAFVIVLSFYTTGCYTIVWDPREEFPDTENSSESSGDFYDYDYYGGYVDYYEAPWWIAPAVYITNPDGTTDRVQTKDRNNGRSSETETIRNSNGRGNTDRNSGINTGTTTTTTTTTNSGSGNNSNVVNTPPPTRNTGSDSSTNSTNSTSNTRNSGSNETRNSSSGSRNTGSGRR
jgi:hypothetical protein